MQRFFYLVSHTCSIFFLILPLKNIILQGGTILCYSCAIFCQAIYELTDTKHLTVRRDTVFIFFQEGANDKGLTNRTPLQYFLTYLILYVNDERRNNSCRLIGYRLPLFENDIFLNLKKKNDETDGFLQSHEAGAKPKE